MGEIPRGDGAVPKTAARRDREPRALRRGEAGEIRGEVRPPGNLLVLHPQGRPLRDRGQRKGDVPGRHPRVARPRPRRPPEGKGRDHDPYRGDARPPRFGWAPAPRDPLRLRGAERDTSRDPEAAW